MATRRTDQVNSLSPLELVLLNHPSFHGLPLLLMVPLQEWRWQMTGHFVIMCANGGEGKRM